MGCSQSRLDDLEAVQLCKDRKQFIKQAVEQRTQFATGHIAYIQSLKRVSAALRDYFEGDDDEFSLDSFLTPPLKIKKTTTSHASFIPISKGSFTPTTTTTIEFGPNTTLKVNYLRPSGNPPISVEERPLSPETVRVEAYSPIHQYGIDSFFTMQSSPVNASIFTCSPNNNRSNIPPPSPQSSQWDFFWNPFSSLDYYGYPTRSSLDQTIADDENRGLRQVREEEGIPDLEEDETEQEDSVVKRNEAEERTKSNINTSKEEVMVEDVDEHEEEEEEKEEGTDAEAETADEVSADSQVNGSECFQVSKAQTAGHIESSHREMAIGSEEAKEETPGFTVYVNRRPTNMAEVMRHLEAQFTVVCNAANDVSALLEAKKAQHLSTPNELSGLMEVYSLYFHFVESVPACSCIS